jgi:hypothetical protein
MLLGQPEVSSANSSLVKSYVLQLEWLSLTRPPFAKVPQDDVV